MGRKDFCALLDRLNFDKMYESDFFLTWKDPRRARGRLYRGGRAPGFA
jgi:hypothetical protein